MGQWLQHVLVNSSLQHIYLNQGRIAKIVPADDPDWVVDDAAWDARSWLMLPTFKDFHVHLDKQFPTDRWISRRRVTTIMEQIHLEKELLAPHQSEQMERARQTIDQMLNYGTTRSRVHVDVDHEIGLRHLETVVQLKEEYRNKMEIEIVVFPQQGLIRSSLIPVVKQALREGATIVGGVDPAGVDQNVDACLDAIFDLSTEFQAEIDIHLHDPGELGLFTLERIADYTQSANKQGCVTVSHAYCLGEISERASEEIGRRLASERIAIITSAPIDSAMPRVEQLSGLGVEVRLGTDHTGLDAWTPFGSADLLSRARRLAEINRWNDDERLRSAYQYLTASSLRFHEGDHADFILIDALNPEHALAASPPREIVAVRGLPVAGRQIHSAW